MQIKVEQVQILARKYKNWFGILDPRVDNNDKYTLENMLNELQEKNKSMSEE